MTLKDWILHVWDAFAALFPPRPTRIPHRLRDNPAAHFKLRDNDKPQELKGGAEGDPGPAAKTYWAPTRRSGTADESPLQGAGRAAQVKISRQA